MSSVLGVHFSVYSTFFFHGGGLELLKPTILQGKKQWLVHLHRSCFQSRYFHRVWPSAAEIGSGTQESIPMCASRVLYSDSDRVVASSSVGLVGTKVNNNKKHINIHTPTSPTCTTKLTTSAHELRTPPSLPKKHISTHTLQSRTYKQEDTTRKHPHHRPKLTVSLHASTPTVLFPVFFE